MNRLLELIKNELEKNPQINTISFDIFDTILFRMVQKPADIFIQTGKKARSKGYLSKHVTPKIYQGLRKEAERKARQKKMKFNNTSEVTFEEIFEELPASCKDNSTLKKLELETEKEYCYLNPDMEELISFLQQSPHYQIILISDMYLSTQQLCEILTYNNFPVDILDKIYVSSELGINKQDGSLFTYIINNRGILSNELLHIGDNYITDVINAQYLGIHTLYYNVISNDNDLGLQLELLNNGNLLPEVYSLRRYVADKAMSMEKDNAGWYRIGSMIMGPIMTACADWVLSIAHQEKIHKIYPLMREGMLIHQLLQQALSYYDIPCQSEPLYISRRSVLLPSIKKWDETAFETLYQIKGATVAALFKILQLDEQEFKKYMNYPLTELPRIMLHGTDGKNYLKKLLFLPKNIDHINQLLEKEQKSFQKYLQRLKMDDEFITIDLGMRGTMQKAISEFPTMTNKKIVHLLMFGATEILEKLMDNIDIRGLVGCAGDGEDLVNRIASQPYLWEQLMMCDSGTTIGYQEDGTPVTKNLKNLKEDQFQKIQWCQKGMLDFQKEYLKLKISKKMDSSLLSLSPQECAKLVFRMFELPTLEEASLLGSLQYDENSGVDSISWFCPASEARLLADIGPENYIKQYNENNSPNHFLWIEGLITKASPAYYLNKILENQISGYDQSIYVIVKKVLNSHADWVVVCGAGEAGRTIRKYLQLYGIQIEAYTDGNKKLQGGTIDGIPVRSLQDHFQTNHYVIASFAYAAEIKQEIQREKGEKAVIISVL